MVQKHTIIFCTDIKEMVFPVLCGKLELQQQFGYIKSQTYGDTAKEIPNRGEAWWYGSIPMEAVVMLCTVKLISVNLSSQVTGADPGQDPTPRGGGGGSTDPKMVTHAMCMYNSMQSNGMRKGSIAWESINAYSCTKAWF